MAYFPNGTSGEIWRGENCAHCLHDDIDGGCPIENVHLIFNYDQHGQGEKGEAIKTILDLLIPRTADCSAGPCPMLLHRKPSQADWMDGQNVIPCKSPLMRLP